MTALNISKVCTCNIEKCLRFTRCSIFDLVRWKNEGKQEASASNLILREYVTKKIVRLLIFLFSYYVCRFYCFTSQIFSSKQIISEGKSLLTDFIRRSSPREKIESGNFSPLFNNLSYFTLSFRINPYFTIRLSIIIPYFRKKKTSERHRDKYTIIIVSEFSLFRTVWAENLINAY